MRTFIKNTLLIALLGLTFGLNSCKKYEEGPFMSFRSPETRVEGSWIVVKATETDTNGNTTDNTADYTDDTYTMSENGTMTYVFEDSGNSVTATGTWQLISDNEILRVTMSWTILGFTFTDTTDWTILRLTNKEMFIQATEDGVTYYMELEAA